MNVVFDLDGTICYDGQTISKELTDFFSDAIYHNPEHRLIFASARPVRDMLPLLPRELRATYLIGGNGTIFYYQNQCQWLNQLEVSDSDFLISYIKKHNLDYLVDEAWNYSLKGATLDHLDGKIDSLKKAQNITLAEIKQPIKILLANYHNQQQVLRDLKDLSVTITFYPRENCLDVTNLGVNKSSALQRIIGKEEYVAFGNDHNDIEMLKEATISVGIGDNLEVQAVSNILLPENPQAIIKLLIKWL